MVMSPGLYENAAGGQLSEVLTGVDPPLEV